MTLNALRAGCAVIAILTSSNALAAAQCTDDVRILAQPRDGLTLLEDYVDEFEALSGAGFEISYLNENDRRAKSQADASTVGSFDVYYVDEANLALFASSGWIVPLDGFYPSEYDYNDFDAGMRAAATYDGKQWFAPVQGGGDLMVYRTDLLERPALRRPSPGTSISQPSRSCMIRQMASTVPPCAASVVRAPMSGAGCPSSRPMAVSGSRTASQPSTRKLP